MRPRSAGMRHDDRGDRAHDGGLAGNITVPFGGYKQSGFGRDKGLHALDGYTQLKTTWFDLSGD